MPSAYERLLQSGFVDQLKGDVLAEAAHDVWYLAAIRRSFAEESSGEAREEATACTVRLVEELVADRLCDIACWDGGGAVCVLTKSTAELVELVDSYASGAFPFDVFLVAAQ